PVTINQSRVMAIPSQTVPAKLWGHTLQDHGVNQNICSRVHSRIDKYFIPVVKEQRSLYKNNLSMLFVLSPNSNVSGVKITQKKGIEVLTILARYSHVRWSIRKSKLNLLMNNYQKIIESVPIYKLEYKKEYSNINQIVDNIESVIIK